MIHKAYSQISKAFSHAQSVAASYGGLVGILNPALSAALFADLKSLTCWPRSRSELD